MLVMLNVNAATAASPAAPTAAALGFNVFVEEDATLTSNETEGPVALGGDLTIGGNYQVGGSSSGTFIDTAAGDTVPSALVVGGVVDLGASAPGAVLSVQLGAYAKVGDLDGVDVRNIDDNMIPTVNTRIVADGALYVSTPRVELGVQQPLASVGPTSPIDFAAAFQDFRASSVALAGCTDNVLLEGADGRPLESPFPEGTNAFLTLTPGVTNVLNISATDLANIETLTFVDQPNATTPLLINVDTSGVDDEFAWNVPNNSGVGGVQAPFILWNFPTATEITLVPAARTLVGTLYAPNAELIDLSAANIDGQVIVEDLVMGDAQNNGGEVHYFPFTATLNCAGPTPTATATPTASPTPTVRPSRSPYGRPYPPRP